MLIIILTWEQRKLSEIMKDFIVPMRDKPKEFGGNIPWTRIEDIDGRYLNGTTSNQYVSEETVKKMNLKIIPKGSLIVSASATFGVVAQVTTDLITNQTFIGLVPHEENDWDFWYTYFYTPSAQSYMRLQSAGSTIFYIAREKFENMTVSVPKSKLEQAKVGSIFREIDNLITLHQRKCEELRNYKKGMLQKMFPQPGETKPQVRFPGFTEDWEQRKLSEVLERYEDPIEIPKDGYHRLGIRSHGKGTFHSYVEKGKELESGKMHVVAANKFIVNITFGWEHAVAITDENDAGKLVSHRFPQFSIADNIESSFLKFLILDKRFKNHLDLSSPGGAGRNRVLKIDQMLDYEVRIPSLAEQRRIGTVLTTVDNAITLHQRNKYNKTL